MDVERLIRAADFIFSSILWMCAGLGLLFASALGQGVAVLVAMAILLEGFILARKVLRPQTR